MDLTWPTVLPARGNQWLFRLLPYLLLIYPLGMLLTGSWLLVEDMWASIFCTLLSLRYTRLIGHVLGSWIYRPALIQPDPRFTCNDVTVILPTVDPLGPDFIGCFRSILNNCPRKILVVTVGRQLLEGTESVLRGFRDRGFQPQMAVSAIEEPGKRRQVAHAIPQVETDVIVLADDHVFWPTDSFLPAVLAGFEDDHVGIVATKKRVRRTTPGKWSWASIVNFIACNYLQRHNWELRASNAIDGGVFVVSGRTAAYRTDFLQDADLLERYCNEKFFFGLFGGGRGLGPDDDNFLTREAMKRRLCIRFQDTEDATMETTLGEWPKFNGQLIRWARTTFQSNPVMLRDAVFMFRYPWSAFMVYWAGILNFALVWDVLLIFTLLKSKDTRAADVSLLLIWMFWTKVVKIIPHFLRHPSDFPLVICQVIFGYVHTFIKLWALLTFWDCDWSGRNLDEVNAGGEHAQFDTSFRDI